jgi:hypothetical protein
MDIFWAIVGALWIAWGWVSEAIVDIFNSRGFTNLLLVGLLYLVNGFYKSYIEFESKKERARNRDIG